MQVKFMICCTAADIFFPQTPGETRRLYLKKKKKEKEYRNQIPAENMCK